MKRDELRTTAQLRAFATAHTLFAPGSLSGAFDRMGFVQADPIRAPARAQDLILRHRVVGYRAGDLERLYPDEDLEEGYLYAYGFLTSAHRPLVHRENRPALTDMAKAVHRTVRAQGPLHSKALDAHFGRQRRTNPWGGQSRAVSLVLDDLHHRGLVRVAHRDRGHRVFEAAREPPERLEPAARLQKLISLAAQVLAPVSTRTLRAMANRFRRNIADAPPVPATLQKMLESGALAARTVDGVEYLFPATALPFEPPPRKVRFLAPFDPLVWDRERFEHLWAWPYRFEAYVPAAKRVRGYYALPILFGTDVIGWVNLSVTDGALAVDAGYVSDPPKTKTYQRLFDAEIARVERFLRVGAGNA